MSSAVPLPLYVKIGSDTDRMSARKLHCATVRLFFNDLTACFSRSSRAKPTDKLGYTYCIDRPGGGAFAPQDDVLLGSG